VADSFEEFYRDGERGPGHRFKLPLWATADTLIARLDEQRIARINVVSGQQTTIVDDDRFLEPADDYRGGSGFAYWHP
jgi:hypothetical protein